MDNVHQTPGAINIRPNKPDSFDGRRDFLMLSSWLYKVAQYLTLIHVSNPTTPIPDETRVTFASSFLTSTASIWWFTIVQSGNVPSSWSDFKSLVLQEFVPSDHQTRARDKLRRLKQTHSVSKYLSEFRNCVLTIADISGGEKFDRFVHGLKKEIRVEVLKSQCSTFDEAATVALRVDSALWSTFHNHDNSFRSTSDSNGGPVPMEIGNLQRRKPLTEEERKQRAIDIRNNACVRCHKKKCRPCICSKSQPGKSVNNLELGQEVSTHREDDDGDLEDSFESEN